MGQTGDLTVRVRALDGTWETIGVDRLRNITVENPSWTHNKWGPDKASFDLHRDAKAIFPDVRGATRVEIETAGELAWGGRVTETPITDDQDRLVNVQCEGMQYHLDDDAYQRAYVHSKLSDFVDCRSLLTADLTVMRAFGQVQQDNGIVLSVPNGTVFPITTGVAVTMDLGQSDAKRIVINLTGSNNDANLSYLVIGSDAPWWNDASRLDFTTGAFGAGGIASGTIANPRRYVTVLLFSNANHTLAADVWLRINSLLIFRDTTYESGNASILTATQVIKDAIATGCPLLSTDLSQISTSAFQIPDFDLDGYRTPRESSDAVNAYENWITLVDEQGRMVFKAKPTAPIVAVGARSAGGFQEASANSLENIYSRVVVEGTGPDGSQLAVSRRAGEQPGAIFAPISTPAPTNPSFDTNTTSWTPSGTTLITRDTVTFDTSPAAGKWTNAAGTDAPPLNATLIETFTGTFKAGTTYRVQFKIRAADNLGLPSFTARLGAGADVGAYVFPNPQAISAWTTVTVVWTPTVTTSAATLTILCTAASQTGTTPVWVDSVTQARAVATLPDRAGYTKTMILPVDSAINTTSAQRIGDLFLASHKTTPFKGTARLVGQRSIWDAKTGAGIHPGLLGRRVNQLLRFEDRIDPDTGGIGRDGTIATVSYDHNTCTATVEIDDTRSNFEALLARLAVVTGAGQ